MQFTDYLPYIYGTMIVAEVLYFLYGKLNIYRQAQIAKQRMTCCINIMAGIYSSFAGCVLTNTFIPLDDTIRVQVNELCNSNLTPMIWQLINHVLEGVAKKHLIRETADVHMYNYPNVYNAVRHVDFKEPDFWTINNAAENMKAEPNNRWMFNRRPIIGQNRTMIRPFTIRIPDVRENEQNLDDLESEDDNDCVCEHCVDDNELEQEIPKETMPKFTCGCANYDNGVPGPCTACHFCGGPYEGCGCTMGREAEPPVEQVVNDMAPRRRFGIIPERVNIHPLQQPVKQ